MAGSKAIFGVPQALLDTAEGGGRTGGLVACAQQALLEAAQAWHKGTLKLHFEAGASARYPGAYMPLTRRYQLRKFRKFGRQAPMVWSGRMRDELLSRTPTIAGKSVRTRAEVKLYLISTARAMNLWKGGSRKHDFEKQLTAINDEELSQIERFVGMRTQELFDAMLTSDGATNVMEFRE